MTRFINRSTLEIPTRVSLCEQPYSFGAAPRRAETSDAAGATASPRGDRLPLAGNSTITCAVTPVADATTRQD